MVIEIFRRRNLLGKARWYFRVVARNGEPVAQSEGYSRRIDCMDTAQILRCEMANAPIVDA